MTSVTPSTARDRIGISASEAPDSVVTQFINDATETIAIKKRISD